MTSPSPPRTLSIAGFAMTAITATEVRSAALVEAGVSAVEHARLLVRAALSAAGTRG